MLSAPGTVDITADVNFAACAQVAREQGAAVQGSISQVRRQGEREGGREGGRAMRAKYM